MSRNIQTLIGPLSLQGLFVPSMGSAAAAMCAQREEIPTLLCLLLRDDIVNWYTSKSSPRNDTKMQELERQLMDRVLKNAALVQGRLKECAPGYGSQAEDDQIDGMEPIDRHVRGLLRKAIQAERLSMMPTPFQPWL